MKEAFLSLRKILKNNKTYLVDDIWPKPLNLKGEMENVDLKKMKEVLKDERLMRICGINPLTDEVLMHFGNPNKYKPTFNVGGSKISL